MVTVSPLLNNVSLVSYFVHTTAQCYCLFTWKHDQFLYPIFPQAVLYFHKWTTDDVKWPQLFESQLAVWRLHFNIDSTLTQICCFLWNTFCHLKYRKLVCTPWHRCQSTACVAFHMMWHASWSSVTFVKTGSMEGGYFMFWTHHWAEL